MSTATLTPPPAAVDPGKLQAFVEKALGDLGSALTAALVVIGDKLGLYRALAAGGPATSAELADRTGTARATLRTSSASGSRRSTACRRSSRAASASPTSAAASAPRRSSWRAPSRARPSSASTIITPSIETARERARAAGVADRVTFEVASAQAYPGSGWDLVACFDCLHDMGDPIGAARHVRESLAPDGTWMLVEPFACDRVEDNLNPLGRLFYSVSTLVCTQAALSQDGTLALGAQAGEARLAEVLRDAGFTRVRRATATPFNLVLEARP